MGFLLLLDYSYQPSNRRAARQTARVVERFDLPARVGGEPDGAFERAGLGGASSTIS